MSENVCVVYVMRGGNDRVLYVGQSIDAGGRLRKHRQGSHWWRLVLQIELRHCAEKAELDRLERELIEEYRPPFNVLLNRGDPPADWPRCSQGCGILLKWQESDSWTAVFEHEGCSFTGSWFCAKCQDSDPYTPPPEWAAREPLTDQERADLGVRWEAANEAVSTRLRAFYDAQPDIFGVAERRA